MMCLCFFLFIVKATETTISTDYDLTKITFKCTYYAVVFTCLTKIIGSNNDINSYFHVFMYSECFLLGSHDKLILQNQKFSLCRF